MASITTFANPPKKPQPPSKTTLKIFQWLNCICFLSDHKKMFNYQDPCPASYKSEENKN